MKKGNPLSGLSKEPRRKKTLRACKEKKHEPEFSKEENKIINNFMKIIIEAIKPIKNINKYSLQPDIIMNYEEFSTLKKFKKHLVEKHKY